MKSHCGTAATVLLSVVGLFVSVSARAEEKLAGSSLLSASDQTQLAAWLGEGPIKLTNVYTKAQGDTSLNFHQAADGKGRTISVMQARNELGQSWLIGGYNPQSWSSSGTYNMTSENAARTAFVFNLSEGKLHRQVQKGAVFDSVGSHQTFNSPTGGPIFGQGYDLYVSKNLSSGFSLGYDYIDPLTGVVGHSLFDGSAYHGFNLTYGAIEVFTIGVVPEPASYAMMFAGLALLAGAARHKGRHGS